MLVSVLVIVIVQLRGIYGSKLTKSEGDSPRTRFVYVAMNPSQLYYKYYISLALEAKHQRKVRRGYSDVVSQSHTLTLTGERWVWLCETNSDGGVIPTVVLISPAYCGVSQ